MAVKLTADVFKDDIAVSLARAIAAANKRARELGIDALQSLITVTQRSFNGGLFWRINYRSLINTNDFSQNANCIKNRLVPISLLLR
jgi:hypothetical protein